ncbi:MAG: type III-B CRISPR module RAMP protein Cmr6 [Bacteroidia bacterium]
MMARLNGQLRHRWNKKAEAWTGEIKGENGKKYIGLSIFNFEGIEKGECEFEADGNKAIAIWIDGEAIPLNTGIVKQKEEEEKAKAERILQREEDERQQEVLDKARSEGVYHPALTPFLPKDVAEELSSLPDGPDNYSLKLNTTANWEDNREKAILFKATRSSDKVHQYVPTDNYGFPRDIWDKLATKLSQQAAAITSAQRSFSLTQEPYSRLAIGLGTASVFGTGILLHPVYGFPFLPATSIKGVTRSWIVSCCFDGEEEKASSDPSFLQMFGSTDQIGSLLFFDAFPAHAPNIKEDIMNPHYPDYYTGEKPPADNQSPIPIVFLTVENTSFQFLLGFKPLPGLEEKKVSGPIAKFAGTNDNALDLLEAGKLWLIKALAEHGIGAKTSLGYGFFKAPS